MTGPRKSKKTLRCEHAIVLVGMMGAGKTTIGRRLAPRLELPFFDADGEIARAAGMSVADLFRLHGEESFRRGEANVIKRLLEGPPVVLATGGGAVLDPETRQLIKEHSISVWLYADLDLIVKRATRRPTRPLLRGGDPKETLARLLAERVDYYRQADIHIESQSGPHAKTVDSVFGAIARKISESGEPREAAQ